MGNRLRPVLSEANLEGSLRPSYRALEPVEYPAFYTRDPRRDCWRNPRRRGRSSSDLQLHASVASLHHRSVARSECRPVANCERPEAKPRTDGRYVAEGARVADAALERERRAWSHFAACADPAISVNLPREMRMSGVRCPQWQSLPYQRSPQAAALSPISWRRAKRSSR
jgi:hypothetical protein